MRRNKKISPEEITMKETKAEKTLKEQSEIVKQRLHYHFAKVGGGWNIEGMNAPFMNEFLNEVQRLVKISNTENKELRETLLKKLMVNLNNTNELSTDMLYKLTDVFEMDAIEIFKEIKSLKQKP